MSQRLDSETEVVTCGSDGKILYWDCDVAEPVQEITDPYHCKINSIMVSPSGKYLAVAGDDYQVKLYDIKTNALLSCGIVHSDVIQSVTWSPDERQIITVGNDCCICIWNFFYEEEEG